MIKIQEIRELIKLIDRSTISELEIESEGTKITIKKNDKIVNQTVIESSQLTPISQTIHPYYQPVLQHPTPPPMAAASSPAAPLPFVEGNAEEGIKPNSISLHKIVSPMVGTFYKAASPDSPPYVKLGDQVREGSVVCIVEAMKLMNEIEAEINGTIVEILVENGQLVEYGQPLFLVKAE